MALDSAIVRVVSATCDPFFYQVVYSKFPFEYLVFNFTTVIGSGSTSLLNHHGNIKSYKVKICKRSQH